MFLISLVSCSVSANRRRPTDIKLMSHSTAYSSSCKLYINVLVIICCFSIITAYLGTCKADTSHWLWWGFLWGDIYFVLLEVNYNVGIFKLCIYLILKEYRHYITFALQLRKMRIRRTISERRSIRRWRFGEYRCAWSGVQRAGSTDHLDVHIAQCVTTVWRYESTQVHIQIQCSS